MASLNLIPNSGVLVVQAGIFLANMVVVKKLIIDPYLQLKDKREEMTLGNQEAAKSLLQACQKKNEELDAQMTTVYVEAMAIRKKHKEQAEVVQQKDLLDARHEAVDYIEKMRCELRQNLHDEREKLPVVIAKLADEVYKASLG